ncbi:hypothetical protein [Acinetobacter sp. MD2]|uniref:hypothetical protein n=1 Tax=Acinetobacter sp. MD2 TaxID=2600066 RepID=UPI002D776430|nr:hypothetical protein [Acinetobacter sp. MD2]
MDAVVAFDCQIREINTVGTHDVFLWCNGNTHQSWRARIGLGFFDRAYHHLTLQQ